MVPILLKFDQQTHDVELGFANQDLAIFNNLLAGINAAIPSLTLTISDFAQLMSDPAGYAFDFIVAGNPLTIGGAPISREVAMTMVEIPDDWKLIISLVNAVNLKLTENTVYKYLSALKGNLQFNRLSITYIEIDNNVFALTAAFTNALAAKYSVYTNTDKQNSIYALLNDIFNNCTQLKTAGASFTGGITLAQLGIIDTANSQVLQFDPSIFLTQTSNQ